MCQPYPRSDARRARRCDRLSAKTKTSTGSNHGDVLVDPSANRAKPSSAGTACGHCPRIFSIGLRPKWAVLQCNEWSRECNRALFPDRTENPMQTELDPLRNNRVRSPWQVATRTLPYLHKTS